MLLPNISSLFKWVNPFTPAAGPTTSQDFLQCIRQSDGTVLGWIDETGTPRGTLAGLSGSRVLRGTNGPYSTSSTSYVDVDDSTLSTSIGVPVGYDLVVLATGLGDGTNNGGFVALNIDGNNVSIANLISSVSALLTYNLPGVVTGDGNSHTVKLRFVANSGSEVLLGNFTAGQGIPTVLLSPAL